MMMATSIFSGAFGVTVLAAAVALGCSLTAGGGGGGGGESGETRRQELPEPRLDSSNSLEKAMEERRSTRSFSAESISLDEASQVLWAAQGVTDEARGYRTAPSAGATYPLNTYLVAGAVDGLQEGVYRYDPAAHELVLVREGDVRAELRDACLGQSSAKTAPAALVFSGVYERTTARYGRRGVRYTHMEAGHAAQNAYLQATALDLGMVALGAFEDGPVSSLLRLGSDEEPLYVLPFGRS